jgi:hypothetical protein
LKRHPEVMWGNIAKTLPSWAPGYDHTMCVCFVLSQPSVLFSAMSLVCFLWYPVGILRISQETKVIFFFQNHKKSFNFYAVQCPRAGALPYTFHTNDFVSTGGIWASFLFLEKWPIGMAQIFWGRVWILFCFRVYEHGDCALPFI